jgi:hypothetical protein
MRVSELEIKSRDSNTDDCSSSILEARKELSVTLTLRRRKEMHWLQLPRGFLAALSFEYTESSSEKREFWMKNIPESKAVISE